MGSYKTVGKLRGTATAAFHNIFHRNATDLYKRRYILKIVLILGLTMLMLGILGASAQPEEVWNMTYGGQGNDVGSSVIESKDGRYIIAGWTNSYGAGKLDAWLIKTDTTGNEIWNRTYGGSGDDNIFSVQETMDGGYILIGSTESYGSDDRDLWLIKTDPEGYKLWDKTFGGRDFDSGSSVRNTKDGGYIIAGATKSYGAGGSDVWLVKVNQSGKEQWNKTFGGPGDDLANSILLTKDNEYILRGSTESYGSGDRDLWLIKTDSRGNNIWDKTFGGPNEDTGLSIIELSDGDYIIAGGANASYNGDAQRSKSDAWLIRAESDGTIKWGKNFSFGNLSYSIVTAVQETADGGYILSGYSFGSDFQGAWAIKTNQEGDKQWIKTFGRRGNKELRSIENVGEDKYLLTGSFGTYEANLDVWMIKMRDLGDHE